MEYGAGIKFMFNAPASRPRNYDIRFIVFQDLNGNGNVDGREQGIPNVLVRISPETPMNDINGNDYSNSAHEYSLLTDEDGVAAFRNLPRGNYVIETTPLLSQGSIAETKRFSREITGNKTVPLPYSDGARLSGSILVQRDQHGSTRDVQLNNIRIAATNVASGNSLNTLTDRNGLYVLYLPVGEYTVRINEEAIDQQFQFVENNILLSVKGTMINYSIHFQMVEKQRNIRFGPANNNGAPTE